MICPFCQYEHDNDGDRFGCPNCNGDGLEGTKMLETPATINQEAWAEWVDYRVKDKRKRVTDRAAKLQWKLLSMYSFEQQRQIIDNSIMNDYQGLFALKGQQNAANQRNLTPAERVIECARAKLAPSRGDVPALASDGRELRPQVVQPEW